MFVCVCHAITDRDIDQAVAQGAVTLDRLKEELDVGTACGCCAEHIEQRLREGLTGAGAGAGYDVSPAFA